MIENHLFVKYYLIVVVCTRRTFHLSIGCWQRIFPPTAQGLVHLSLLPLASLSPTEIFIWILLVGCLGIGQVRWPVSGDIWDSWWYVGSLEIILLVYGNYDYEGSRERMENRPDLIEFSWVFWWNPLLKNEQGFSAGKLVKWVTLTFNPLTPKISSVILLTVCYTVLVMLVWRILDWIKLII